MGGGRRKRGIRASSRLRPASVQLHHAGGQGTVSPCHEQKKGSYPQERLASLIEERAGVLEG